MGNVSSTSSGGVTQAQIAPPSAPANALSRLFSRAQNTPVSLAGPSQRQRLPEITNETFLYYINNVKPSEPEPRVFWGIHFNRSLFETLINELEFHGDTFVYCTFECVTASSEASEKIAKPVKFIGVKFSDCVFRPWASLPEGSELRECKIHFSNFRADSVLRRFRFKDFSPCWVDTTVDGALGQVAWTASEINLSGIDMRNGAIKNVAFYNPEDQGVINSNLSGIEFNNVAFNGTSPNAGGAYYEFNNVDLRDLKARNLMLKDVRFIRVRLDGAEIINLVLYGVVDFSQAEFGYYRSGSFILGEATFRTVQQIDIGLNSISNPQRGANFFNTLKTIGNQQLQIDLAERLTVLCGKLAELRRQLRLQPLLVLSVINGLCEYAAHSAAIHIFITDQMRVIRNMMLPIFNSGNRLICQNLVSLFKQLSATLDNRFDYQFLVHQLMLSDPSLKAHWYKNPLLRRILLQISLVLKSEIEDIEQDHIFFSPAAGRGIYIAADGFRELLSIYQVPTAFTHFTYGAVGEIEILPSDPAEVNKTLNCFPQLHKIWSTAGKTLAPVLMAMLEADAELSGAEKKRLQEIRQHFVCIICRVKTDKMVLTSARDVNTLHSVLARFYQGNGAAEARQRLIRYMQTKMEEELIPQRLSDAQQKSIAALMLARILTSISSTTYCGVDEDSPRPLRELARVLIADCQGYWPGLVKDSDAKEWQEKLVPVKRSTFCCSWMVADSMSRFSPPRSSGEEGRRVAAIVKQLYPL